MTSPIETHLSLPTAEPIAASFANDDIEAALKQLFADLFEQHLASALHDANALGMPHLGTFDLVRRNVNTDGLALLPGSSEEDATRYLYRAWRSRDSDGRGLHFLKTYLQMLFPNLCELEQMMQSKHQPYPLDLYPASLHSGDPDKYLTSRIEIGLDYSTEMTDFTRLMSVFRAILPARLSPLFKFRLLLLVWLESRIDSTLFLQKAFNMKANPCGLRVSESTEFLWQLGRDIDYKKLGHDPAFSGLVGQSLVKLQNYDSTFNLDVDGQWKVGQWQGGVWIAPPPKLDGSWPVGINTTYECFVKLGDCRIRTSALLSKFTQTKVYQPHLNQPGLTLNGLWHIVERMTSRVLMTSKTVITAPQHIETTFGEHLRCEYPFTPKRLNGGAFGFPVRKPGIYIDTATGLNKTIEGHVNPEKLKLPRIAKLDGHALDGHWKIGGDHGQRTLNGAWKIGATHWIIDSHTALDLQTHAQQPLVVDVTSSNHTTLDYPYKTRLARLPKLNPWHSLNGTWQVGRAESKAPFGFKLRETGVLVDHTASLVKQHSIDGLGRYHYLRHSNKLDGQSLTGKWQLGGGDKHFTLNGKWRVGERYQQLDSHIIGFSHSQLNAKPSLITTFGDHTTLDYPYKTRLARLPKLNPWHSLNGTWQVGRAESKAPFGFKLRETGVLVDHTASLVKQHSIDGLGRYHYLRHSNKLDGQSLTGKWQLGGGDKHFTLNGTWRVGERYQQLDSHIIGFSHSQLNAKPSLITTFGDHTTLDYPYKTRLARLPKLNPWHSLNGTWQLGRAESKAPFGFKLRETGVLVDHTAALIKQQSIDGLGRYHYLRHSNKLDGQSLTGKWQLGGGDKHFTLNGKWRVGERYQQLDSHIIGFSHSQLNAKPSLITTFGDHTTLDYPYKTRLARLPKLNPWHSLNGTWQLGRAESKAPFGFKLREKGVLVETHSTNSLTKLISAYGVYNTLPPLKRLDAHSKLNGTWQLGGSRCALPLNGSWQLGRRKLLISSTATLTTQTTLAIPQHVSFSSSDHVTIHYPGRQRLGKPAQLTQWQSFNSGLKLGGAISSKPFGFPLYADESIPIDSTVNIGIDKIIDVIDNRLKLGKTAQLSRLVKLNGSQTLSGTWQVGGSSGHVLLNGSFKLGGAIKHSLSVNGTWKLGQRTQLVYSSAVMRTEDALSIQPTAEASIAIYKGNFFSFFNEAGAVNYQLISTMSPDQPPQPNNVLINNRLRLSPPPVGDIFLHKGIVYREIEPGVLLAEDYDNVSVVVDAGVYYAQFDSAVNLNGLYAEVTYLAVI